MSDTKNDPKSGDHTSEREAASGSTDGRLEAAKDAALGPHDDNPSVADQISEGAGGISGAVVGASVGSSAGPVGTLLGGIAGAIGGWWSGRAISEAAEKLTHEDEAHYRTHYEQAGEHASTRPYDEVRGAYYLGQIASHNPNFTNRMFEEVEPELKRGWEKCPNPPCDWATVRPLASEGYRRGVERRSFVDRRQRYRANETERRVSWNRRDGDTEEA